MKLMRAATLSVADLDRSIGLYCDWLDYSVEEQGVVNETLAASWGTPNSSGSRCAVLRPSSGHDIFIRLVENRQHPDFKALTTYGWSAIEICVQDVLAANERMLESPFEIIGPPKELDGLPAIYPMQVQGPDGEIAYLTQIRDDLPEFDLPRAEAPIDRLFILVLACSDMNTSLDWLAEHGNISSVEMRRTFNCGVGMILAVSDADVDTALATLTGLGEDAWQIGHVAKDDGPVEYR